MLPLSAVALGTCALLSGWVGSGSAAQRVVRVMPAATAPPPTTAYSVLTRPQAPGDDLSDQRYSVSKLAETMPVDQRGARVLERDADGEIVTLVPLTNGRLCLHVIYTDGTAGGGCAPDAEADSTGIVAGQPGAQVGLVPDGVSQVSVSLSDGSVTNVPVTNNVFHAPPDGVAATMSGTAVQLMTARAVAKMLGGSPKVVRPRVNTDE
jgi:hypothetical protein